MINIDSGVAIIMDDWLKVKNDELVHFITDETHMKESEAVSKWARSRNIALKVTVLPSHLIQNGDVIEKMVNSLLFDNVIIGATSQSFITTNAVNEAIKNGARFLSLPLSCTDGSSLIERDFIKMNPSEAKKDCLKIMKKFKNKKTVHITTDLGTDLSFSIEGRTPGYFCGYASKAKQIGSSSFEAYIAPNEDSMNGTLVLDGSFGYLGLVKNKVTIEFKNGKLISAKSKGKDAKKLIDYIESFNDKTMYRPGEFGIGLNKKSKCTGVCYIEDESVYGTFHLGMGRNISLGGKQSAKGHFDIVTFKPNIYFDDLLIMKNGELL